MRQRRQAAQNGWDGAAERIVAEVSARTHGGSQHLGSRAQCRRHAQLLERSQADQAGRDGAAQLVVVQLSACTRGDTQHLGKRAPC